MCRTCSEHEPNTICKTNMAMNHHDHHMFGARVWHTRSALFLYGERVHVYAQTLGESTRWTPVATCFVDSARVVTGCRKHEWSDIYTLLPTYACVLNTSTYGAFEKARTSITTIHAVVTTERLVTAHLTRHRHGQCTACTVQSSSSNYAPTHPLVSKCATTVVVGK